MQPENPESDKKRGDKFKIENLPHKVRKKIFVFAIILIMLIILTLWVMSLQTSFLNSSFNQANSVDKAETDGQAAESIKKDLNQLFDVTKNLLEQMKNRAETVNQSLTATTTP